MAVTCSRWLAIWLVALAAAAACGTPSLQCGTGTVASGGACVPASDVLQCGPGTIRVDALCVATDDGGAQADTSSGTDASAATDQDTAATTDGPDNGSATDTSDGSSCAPNCVGRVCGPDGCGGSCGTCASAANPTCDDVSGQCVAQCVPQCLNKDCGDDGCGGLCGTCSAGQSCQGIGRCVPPTWICAPESYNGGVDPCDCNCGAADPDCKKPGNLLAGCSSVQTCSDNGTCVDKAPAAWTCAATAYGGLDDCNCGCGAPDPDCGLGLPVFGCKTGETCSATGTCQACQPDCNGKDCGPDGCGGSCGTCSDSAKPACNNGQCVDPCKPLPILCATNDCGNDGCGGSCGTCASGEQCNSGSCEAIVLPIAPTSCEGHCGSTAPSGCYCVPACSANGSCCADFQNQCACKPQCTGKQCGDDGCGGSCGECKGATPYCGSDSQCTAACTKNCAGKECGNDGCGASCGSCSDGAACTFLGQCLPAAWYCPAGYFGDGLSCDCGCGAVDPDCKNAKLPTYGCPFSDVTCLESGICQVPFCAKNSECGVKWCSGLYPAGGGWWRGTCKTPESLAKPPGVPCSANGECATDACIGGTCAQYCQADDDCSKPQKCLGSAIFAPVTGQAVGVAGVCQFVPGSAVACTSQASCPGGEICQGFANAVSAKAKYLCTTGTVGANGSCTVGWPCSDGKICAPVGSGGGICTVACPAGAADCPSNATCQAVGLFGNAIGGLGDEPKVAVCIPK